MTLPFLSLGREPEASVPSAAGLRSAVGQAVVFWPQQRPDNLGQWLQNGKIQCVEILHSLLGISSTGHTGPPARPWHSANCGKGSRDGKTTAPRLAVLFASSCWRHPVHTWESIAFLPWHLESMPRALRLLHGRGICVLLPRETPRECSVQGVCLCAIKG